MRTTLRGRTHELSCLRAKYLSPRSELVVLYGRRRVGKSTLIHEFISANQIDAIKSRRSGPPGQMERTLTLEQTLFLKQSLTFEGLENQETSVQIQHFVRRLKHQIHDSLLQKARFESWHDVFDFLTEYFEKQRTKTIVAFDEFQWMAAGQSKLVALLKYYWDNHWKSKNVMLILCGSIASFMVKKVIRSKALYGRFSLQLHVKKLNTTEALSFFPKTKPLDELLRYLLVFGGVPKYLEEINPKKSFEQNLEALFFREDALFFEEFEKIFNVHFKEPRTYLKIIRSLDKRILSLEEISKIIGMKSSGGVKEYLDNLELAEFVRSTHTYLNNQTRYARYKISDEFSYFYSHFVLPNKRIIQAGGGAQLFRNKIVKQLVPWFGFAFENYVTNNALYFAEKLGFADKVESFGPYYKKGEVGVQVDLIYYRSDKTISVCEIKFQSEAISTEVIPEFEAKLKKLPLSKKKFWTQKILLAPNGVTEALRKTEYFDLIATAEELLW